MVTSLRSKWAGGKARGGRISKAIRNRRATQPPAHFQRNSTRSFNTGGPALSFRYVLSSRNVVPGPLLRRAAYQPSSNQERVLRGDNVRRHFWIPDDEHISPPVRPVGKDQSREILLVSSWPHRTVPGACPGDSRFSPL